MTSGFALASARASLITQMLRALVIKHPGFGMVEGEGEDSQSSLVLRVLGRQMWHP
jgi:hypothetical protein